MGIHWGFMAIFGIYWKFIGIFWGFIVIYGFLFGIYGDLYGFMGIKRIYGQSTVRF